MMKRWSKKTWAEKIALKGKLQKQNWEKHFKKHPEQRSGKVEICRMVPIAELKLLAQIIWQASMFPTKC
jgi:hypothetical protein